MLLRIAMALALASTTLASQVSVRAPPVQRQVRAIVARVNPHDRGTPATDVWLLVLDDLVGAGGRWVSLRVPGARIRGGVVSVPGFPLPRPGDRVRLTLRTRLDDAWLLSLPSDWEPTDERSRR